MLLSHFTRPAAMVLGGLQIRPGITPKMPESLDLEGLTLSRVSQGIRERLYVNLYSLGLYLPGPVGEVEEMRDHDLAKALRVEIIQSGAQADGSSDGWWEELIPMLGRDRSSRLRNLFRDLTAGDVIVISYRPERGTRLEIGTRTVLSDPGHGLMSAYIDLWLGGNPVSGSLREDLL